MSTATKPLVLQEKILVVESLLSQGILGLDILQYHSCVTDLAQQHLKVPDENLVILLVSSTFELWLHGIEIDNFSPFHHASWKSLAATPENVKNGTTWLMEEKKPGNQTPFLIAQSVVCPNDNKVVMCLLNPCS